MERSHNRREREYGYRSLEQGVDFSRDSRCSFLQILHYKAADGTVDIRVSSGDLIGDGISEWILKDLKRQSPATGGGNERQRTLVGGLRLLYGACTYDSDRQYRQLPFSEDLFDLLSEHLGLPEQFIPSFAMRTGCAFKFQCPSRTHQHESERDGTSKPDICHIFKFSIFRPSYYHLAVSHSPTNNITHCVLLAKASDHEFPSLTSKLQEKANLALNPMFLPTLLSELCTASTARRIHEAHDKLNQLEELMGQHEWENRPLGDPLEMDFLAATRRLNFVGMMLGVERMRVKGLLLNLGVMREGNRELSGGCEEEARLVEELVAFHANSCENLALRVEYEQTRVQTQIAVVYQFMAQKDARVNIELATTSASIAKETKKDGSSMKTIALLTMCFLPGTFLAALFAMPMNDDDQFIKKKGFKYYWAVAIPLTVLVILVWALATLLPRKYWLTSKRTGPTMRDVESTNFKDQ